MFTVTKTTQGAYTAYVLADTGAGTTATVVPEKGGMVTSFTKNGDEYSWLREPNFSQPERPRCAMPVLFPMCGRAPQDANTFGGKSYPMIIHGIVHSMPWQVVETGETDGASVTVRVTDNAETRESYPFASALPSGMCSGAASCALSRPMRIPAARTCRSPSVSIPISVFPMCATWSGISKPA